VKPGSSPLGLRATMADQGDLGLNQARIDGCMSHADLWMRYFGLGGISTALEIEAYVYGALEPSAHDYNLLAHALNERFAELGHEPAVPYRHS
jgi:hypothetical protein